MADARIDGGLVGVVLDGETVKRVDVEVGEFEGGDLVFDFQTQHFVVRKLQNAQVGKRLRQRQNGGGFAGSGAGFYDDVAASTDMVQDRLLFFTGFVHCLDWLECKMTYFLSCCCCVVGDFSLGHFTLTCA